MNDDMMNAVALFEKRFKLILTVFIVMVVSAVGVRLLFVDVTGDAVLPLWMIGGLAVVCVILSVWYVFVRFRLVRRVMAICNDANVKVLVLNKLRLCDIAWGGIMTGAACILILLLMLV